MIQQGKWLRKPKNGLNVVFIHGINSSDECWRSQTGAYWPDLLRDESELESIGIYLFSYRTGFNTGSYSLGDIVDSLNEHISNLDRVLESDRVIFVCHSMGGIIARRFVVREEPNLIEKGLKRIGLFLVASPSLGSGYANMLSLIPDFLGHTQAKILKFSQNNVWLNDLDKDFINLKEANRLNIIGKELIEDLSLEITRFFGLKKQIVEPFSGARYFGQSYKVPDSDHITIAKPESKDAVQHRQLVDFIKNFEQSNKSSKAESNNITEELNKYLKKSNEWCIQRFRLFVNTREEAIALAEDPSLGAIPIDLSLDPGKLQILVGEFGIGKTLIAQRIYKNCVEESLKNLENRIPVFLEPNSWSKTESLQDAILNECFRLGNPKSKGALVIIDELDQASSTSYFKIISEAEQLVYEWKNTTIIITSRPNRFLDNKFHNLTTKINKLEVQQSVNLINRVCKKRQIISLWKWPDSLKDAVSYPLFALILGKHLSSSQESVYPTTGELLNWLVRDAIEDKNRNKADNKMLLLANLAKLLIENCSDLACTADLDITHEQEIDCYLVETGLVYQKGTGYISFTLPILKEWFGAIYLADNTNYFLINYHEAFMIARWLNPLIIAVANPTKFNSEKVGRLLIPIAERYPLFVAEIIRSSTSRFGAVDISLPSQKKCGYLILEAMRAWVKGFGPFSQFIAPTDSSGNVLPLGIYSDESGLTTSWYRGEEEVEDECSKSSSKGKR